MTELESGFRVGGVEVRPIEGLIVGPRGEIRIEPKAMAVLIELVRHAGQVCSREQIQRNVWPRGYTTDDVLTRCIGQIRNALGDDPKNPTHVETLPRRGYRLLQPITKSKGPEILSAKGRKSSIDKLIVLPFQYLSSDGHDYIADGIVELLTARLAGLQDITVLSRTTAMHFRDSKATLATVVERTNANWVVEGSVLQSDNRMQVVVQLIDARTDAHIWADDYVRDVGDMLVLQNDIAQKIAVAIRVRLGVADTADLPPVVLEADTIREYLLGRHLLSNRSVESLRKAVHHFSNVCKSAPNYASAFASRAEANFMLGHYGAESPDTTFAACRADLDYALTQEPDLAIALTGRGVLFFGFERDLQRAEQYLLRALQFMPGYSIAMLTLGNVYAAQGRFPEAMRWLDQALLVDPLDVGINMNIGDHLILQRRFNDATAAFEKAIELAPGHRPSQLRLCWAHALAGNAKAASEQLTDIGPTDDVDRQWFEYAALVAGKSGDSATARRFYEKLARLSETAFVSPWSLARAAAAAGHVDDGIRWLEQAKSQRSTSFPFANVTPAFDELRNRPEFVALVA